MTQNNSMIRPAWTPATIALMVLGFIIYKPLGLVMLAYILWGDRLDGFKQGLNRATDSVADTFSRSKDGFASQRSGNAAFDEWREKELARIAEERRKLEEDMKEFEDYKREVRKAQDTEEFDAFMKSRKRKPAPRSRKSTPKD